MTSVWEDSAEKSDMNRQLRNLAKKLGRASWKATVTWLISERRFPLCPFCENLFEEADLLADIIYDRIEAI